MSVDERGADAGPLGPTEEGAGGRQPAARAAIEGRSPWALAIQRLRKDRAAMISLGFIILIILIAIFAPVFASITGHPPNEQYHGAQALTEAGLPKGPSGEFWWGTDDLGRDVLVRTAYGARISLLVGVLATALTVAIGVVLGLAAGFFGGIIDTVLSRLVDVVLSVPFLLAVLALVSIFGASLTITVLVIGCFSWASVARIVRGQVLSLREREFVEAARSLGSSDWRIMFVDILPNVLTQVIVYTTLLIPVVIVTQATLSFLGLGLPPPTADWGGMISGARNTYTVAPWYIGFPSAALILTTLAFNLFGDGVADAFDPRADRLISG
jgi:ABC-type dipeptide/oligopeptide/nickel transport system permease subunit